MSGPFDDDEPTLDPEISKLNSLGDRFLAALAAKNAGKIDDAEDQLRTLIREEPRLGEPHLELARLLLDTDRISEAEDHAREAIEQFEHGGVWTEELPENVVRALAHATLAETLRRHAEDDEVIFGDPAKFHAILAESKQEFAAAAALDPSDEYASYYGFFLGLPGQGGLADKHRFDESIEDEN